ncbi:hypothetical protein SLE2022_329550 [Rubroshorea leprosula]
MTIVVLKKKRLITRMMQKLKTSNIVTAHAMTFPSLVNSYAAKVGDNGHDSRKINSISITNITRAIAVIEAYYNTNGYAVLKLFH